MNTFVFLSCLYGSEGVPVAGLGIPSFLSCLYGSEAPARPAPRHAVFLSCLYGSEDAFCLLFGFDLFLSCLYGSEVDTLLDNPPFSKKNMRLQPFYPFFYQVL